MLLQTISCLRFTHATAAQPGVQPYGIWVLVQTLQTVRRVLLLGVELTK